MFSLRIIALPLLAACLAASQPLPARADDLAGADAQEPSSRRPRIGLALSGGGARGFAHVGVLEVMEELRIPVDYVAGTSMGAIVGGLYSAGLSAEELRNAVIDVDWLAAFNDRTPRQEVSFRRKQDSFDFLTSLRVWIKGLKVALPRGLIAGQKLENLLSEIALPAATVRDFDELPIPFRAVATDSATGDPVAIGSGELVRAMWASMAVPAIFSPVAMDGKQLIDGGVSNNMPIDVVRAMGADVVIAIDISGRLMEPDEVQSVFSVSGQSLTVLMLRNTDAQIATLTDGDLLITPELGQLGSASFDEGPALVEAGVAAGQEAWSKLEAFSVSPEAYAEYRASRRELSREPPLITSLRYENTSPLSDRVIEERFDVVVGRPLDLVELEHDMAFLYGEEIFDRVGFALEQTQEGTELILRTLGKEQGRNVLRFGLRLESDFTGESNFDIAALLTRNPVNSLGGEWRSKLQFGDETRFRTEFFQPLTPRNRLFLLPSFSVGITTRDVFNDGGDRLAKYRLRDLDIRVAVGTHISNVAEIKAGVGYVNGDLKRTSGDPSIFGDQDFDGFAAFAQATFDTLDSVAFPRSGGYGFVAGQYLPDAVGEGDGIERVEGALNYAWSLGNTTLLSTLRFGTTFDGKDVLPTFALGGFLKLSGTSPESRTGSTLLLARLVGYHRIANPRVFSWSIPVYLGGSFEVGNTFEDVRDIEGDELDLAGSVFLGVDTFLGPIYIAYGHAEGGQNAGYVFLGQVF